MNHFLNQKHFHAFYKSLIIRLKFEINRKIAELEQNIELYKEIFLFLIKFVKLKQNPNFYF